MADLSDLGEWEFIGRRGGETVRLVPGEKMFASPKVMARAQQSCAELQFDFMDDGAVLRMLRRRHEDELAMFDSGLRTGTPLALVGFVASVVWGGVVQYWESDAARTVYLAVAIAAVLILLAVWVRTALSHWRDPAGQNLRARARRYRDLAHMARREGGDIPAHYPHYGPYPFAATFHPEASEAAPTKGEDV